MNSDHYEDIPAQIIKLKRENAAEYEEMLQDLWFDATQSPELDIYKTTADAREALFFTLGYLPELFPPVLNWTIKYISQCTSRTKISSLCSMLNELSFEQKQFLPEIRRAFLGLIQNEKDIEIRRLAASNLIPPYVSELDSSEPSHEIVTVLIAQTTLWQDADFSELAISALKTHISHTPELLDQAKAFIQEHMTSEGSAQRTAALRLAGALRHMDTNYFSELGNKYISDPDNLTKYAAQCLVTPPTTSSEWLDFVAAYGYSDMPRNVPTHGATPLSHGIPFLSKEDASTLGHSYEVAENKSRAYLAKFSKGDPYAVIKYAKWLRQMHIILRLIKESKA